jgi:hypothetical protein
MPRKLKQKQKQKQNQRQSIVVNVGEVRRKRRATGARRRAPKQTIEEAEYIAALNRTMPAVQINPIPATQQVPLLSQEQAVGLLQSALSSRPPAEKSIAQRDVERRDAATNMQRANDALENTLVRTRNTPAPEIPGFTFTPSPAIVPMGEPAIPTTDIPLMAAPTGQELTTIADKPRVQVQRSMDTDNRDNTRPLTIQMNSLPTTTINPIDIPDRNFDFNATTVDTNPMMTPVSNETKPRASRMPMAARIAERFGIPKEQALQRYEKEIAILVDMGKTRKEAQDILTKRYKAEDKKEERLEQKGLVSRMKSRPSSSALMTQAEPQKEMIYVTL